MKLYRYLIRFDFGTIAGNKSHKERRCDSFNTAYRFLKTKDDGVLYQRNMGSHCVDYVDSQGVAWLEHILSRTAKSVMQGLTEEEKSVLSKSI
jgi:hypothetical protein